MKSKILFLISLIAPLAIFAQEKGLDERVNDAFMPFAEWWEGLVLTKVNLGFVEIPLVLILLIGGATFFTIYFKFPSITKMGLAIQTVRGKYDEVDHHEAENAAVNIVDGDVKGTIEDEGKEGEVSHFQALATAVSGTVGLGNIAGVAVAIAMGGPGATFWMIVVGILG
ncbi:MAG: sodium:alanine symporter family protein, partial [Flavobacteriaceae bacterium]|nr:sodium:alanine symporter family protein [Flavobacteriaceae bacterium]